MSNVRVWTTGYQGKRPEALLEQVVGRNAKLIDIRLRATSELEGWNKADLVALFGGAYHHLPYLGNRAKFDPSRQDEDAPIEIANLDKGLEFVRRTLVSQPLILMCACRKWEGCHRTVVANALWDIGIRTEELPDVDKPIALRDESPQAVPAPSDSQEEVPAAHPTARQQTPRHLVLTPYHTDRIAPPFDELMQWSLTRPDSGIWMLTDPQDAGRAAWMYDTPWPGMPETTEPLYRVAASSQVGHILPPPQLYDGMTEWEAKPVILEWQMAEILLLNRLFRQKIKAQKQTQERRAA